VKVDRFKNPVELGSVIAYSGSSIGMIIGVVIKMNPNSYRVKYMGKNWKQEVVESYVNIPYSYGHSILTIKSFKEFDKMSLLDDVEKLRLGLSQ